VREKKIGRGLDDPWPMWNIMCQQLGKVEKFLLKTSLTCSALWLFLIELLLYVFTGTHGGIFAKNDAFMHPCIERLCKFVRF
jgi:hypothetical protein